MAVRYPQWKEHYCYLEDPRNVGGSQVLITPRQKNEGRNAGVLAANKSAENVEVNADHIFGTAYILSCARKINIIYSPSPFSFQPSHSYSIRQIHYHLVLNLGLRVNGLAASTGICIRLQLCRNPKFSPIHFHILLRDLSHPERLFHILLTHGKLAPA